MSDIASLPIPEGHFAAQFSSGNIRYLGDDPILLRFYRGQSDCRILRIAYTPEDES